MMCQSSLEMLISRIHYFSVETNCILAALPELGKKRPPQRHDDAECNSELIIEDTSNLELKRIKLDFFVVVKTSA
jgi:hypothetical protein